MVLCLVNTTKCGDGGRLMCIATHEDGSRATVQYEFIEDHFYRVRVFPLKTGPLHLHFDHLED